MTQASSNSFRVEIVAASSAIEAAAAGIASGAWGTFTVGNQLLTDPNGTGNSMLTYSPRVTMDTSRRVMKLWGGEHGNTASVRRLHLGNYDIAANQWIGTTPFEAPMTPANVPTHGFYTGDVNQSNGDFCCFWYGVDSQNLHRFRYATQTWDAPYPSMAPDNYTKGVAYHPNLFGGQGGYIMGSPRGVFALNVNAGSPAYTTLLNRINEVDAMADGPAAVYDWQTDCVYIGGSQSGWTSGFYKVTAAGVVTSIQFPTVGMSAGTGGYVLVPSGISGNKLIAMNLNNGTCAEFNGTSWSSVTANFPANIFSTQQASFGVFPNVGIVGFRDGSSGAPFRMDTTAYIWKR